MGPEPHRSRVRILMLATTLAMGLSTSCQRDRPREDNPVLRVVEVIHNRGWETCGVINAYSDGSYTWEQANVWSNHQTRIFRGNLPPSLVNQIHSQSFRDGRWEKIDGVPSYHYSIADTMTRHPVVVTELVRTLSREHKEPWDESNGCRTGSRLVAP